MLTPASQGGACECVGTPGVKEIYEVFATLAVERSACFSPGLYGIIHELVRWYHA